MPLDSNKTPRRLLAIRLDNIGDVVMLSPALRALRAALPEAHITLMASPAGSQAASLLPWVDDVLVWRALWQDISGELAREYGREEQLFEELRRRRYDVAIIFTSFSQSPYPPAYACFLAEIPIRVGQSREFGGSLLSHWAIPPADSAHQVDRNLALLAFAGFTLAGYQLELHMPPDLQAEADHLLREAGIDPHAPFAVLAPGASCAARRYDPLRFARLARQLYSQSGLPIAVVGSPRESAWLAPLLEAARLPGPSPDGIVSLAGRTSVPQLAGVIRRACLVVANNSACLHIADAFEVPMVILYSGTETESQWMPRRAPARLLRRFTACSPCHRFECPYDMECLDIPPEEAVRAALELLGEPQAIEARNGRKASRN